MEEASDSRPYGDPDATDEPEGPGAVRRLPRLGNRWVVAAVLTIVTGLLLVAPLVLHVGWSPLAHWACAPGRAIESPTFYAPGVVANAPFGGRVWANGTFPWNESAVSGAGGNESNGGSFADLSTASFSVAPAQNVTAWGPGENQQCHTPYLVSVGRSTSSGVKLLGLLPQGTRNDTTVPEQVPAEWINDFPSVVFDGRFLSANNGYIDTCRSSQPVERTITTSLITVGVPVDLPSGATTLPVVLPVTASFHYWFPPGFGVWEVDDLSANGGLPGAGWAFAFYPCG